MAYANLEKLKAYRLMWRAKNKDKIRQQAHAYWLAHKNKEYYARKWKEWSVKNREHLREYRLKNKERIKASIRACWKKNPEKYKALVKNWMIRNKDRLIQKQKIWNASNPDKRRAIYKKYRQTHPDAWRKHDAKRRAAKMGIGCGDTRLIQKWEECWRSKSKAVCYWCKQTFHPKSCHTDHIVALILGGSHSIENLCISCASCNQHKNGKSLNRWNAEIAQPVLIL